MTRSVLNNNFKHDSNPSKPKKQDSSEAVKKSSAAVKIKSDREGLLGRLRGAISDL